MIERKLFFSWVRATSLGWLLGIPLIIALALLGEAIGIGGAQFIVGAGMGAGIGLMQSRALRGHLDHRSAWVWSCVVGLGSPFLAVDAAKLWGWSPSYFLPACVAIGGLLTGAWQSLLLRRRFAGWRAWIVASVLGWALAAGAVAFADSLWPSQSIRGIGGALAYLGSVLAGGLLLGLVTGPCMAWMLRRAVPDAETLRSDAQALRERIERAVRELISIASHDAAWRESFEKEKEHLLASLPGELIRRIEHFGSTAVPGLAAKPIVDILVEVTDLQATRTRIAPLLESLGYEYFWRPTSGDDGPPFYAWFIKRDAQSGARTHHIHMVEAHFTEHWDRLLFRDYLIEHPDVASEYERLKIRLASLAPRDRVAYTQGKSEFIERVTKQAKSHYGAARPSS